jgi:hypothetical protein
MARFENPCDYTGAKGSKTQTGSLRLANSVEAAAGIADNIAISPATLASAVGGLVPSATTLIEGVVLITDNTSPVATKAYADALAIAGAPVSTETVAGIGQLATDAEAVNGTLSTGALALLVTPSNFAAVFDSPPPLGNIAPATGAFTAIIGTTIEASDLLTALASATINTAGTTLNLATDVDTAAVNIGTAAAARVITLGNVTGASQVVINSGTAGIQLASTGAGDITINSDDTLLLDADGVLELNSSAGVISIGNDADANNINIGTGAAARTITVGNSTGATSLVLDCGTGVLNIGTNAIAHTITVGNGTGATAVVIESGTGAITVGANAIAHVITIGNVTGATGVAINVGTGNFALNGVTSSTYAIGAATTTGSITIGGTAQTGDIVLGSSSGTNAVKIMNGAGAGTLSLGVVQVAGAINMGTAMTTGTITIGGTGLQTGTISLAPGTGAQTVNIATGGTGVKTVNIATGAIGNIVTIGSVTAAASMSLLVGTGNFSLDGAATSAYTFAPSTTSGTINFGGTGANTGIMTIAGGTGAQTLNIASSTGGKAVNIANGASANLVTIGSITGASSMSLLVGTGNFSLDGAATSNYTFAPSTTSGTINFGGTGANTGTATILGGTGVQICNMMASTGVKTLNIATGAAANQVVIGTENTTAKLDLKAGSGAVNVYGNLSFANVATKMIMNGGAVTDFIGRATLVAGTVTIACTGIAATDRIFVTRYALNGSPALGHLITTISAGASFTIAAYSSTGVAAVTDVSSVDYVIVGQS